MIDGKFLINKPKKIFSTNTYRKLRCIYILLYMFAVFTRFLSPISLLEPPLVNSLIFAFVAFFGVCVIFVDIFCDKILFSGKNAVFLSLFLVVTAISSVLNIKYGIFGNIRNLVWLATSFFILYPVDKTRTKDEIYREIQLISRVLIFVWNIAVISSLAMFLLGIGFYVNVPPDSFIRFGFIESRLFGIFEDPNFAATTSILVIMFSCWNIIISRKKLNFCYILAIILNYIYIVLSGSRTAQICIMVIIMLFSYFFLQQRFYVATMNKFLKQCCFLFIGVSTCVTIFVSMDITKQAISYLPPTISQHFAVNSEPQGKFRPIITQRDDIKNSADISNCRFRIWKSAAELFKSKPLFGTSPRNMRAYAKAEFPDSFIGKRGYAVHNIYLDILTSNGIFGAVVIAVFFIKYLVYAFRYLFFNKKYSNYLMVLFCFSVIAGIAASAMFLSEIFFVNTIGVLFFWLCLGYCLYFIDTDTCEK